MHRTDYLPASDEEPISAVQLRCAFERGEFELHYQPKVDLATGAIIGAEALLRWRHGDLGLIPPLRFLPVAEMSGLSVELGDWTRRQVATMGARVNRGRALPLRLSSNVSVLDLSEVGFYDSVIAALGENDCKPGWLILEVTETASVIDPVSAGDSLQRLRRLGVGIALDDFGTGYSSLCRLLDWPFSEIKIDRTFIAGLEKSGIMQVIVGHAIGLGRDLSLDVVAEGIETAEEYSVLLELGCPIGQGFLFGRPMEDSAFEALVAVPGNSSFRPPKAVSFQQC